jgi:hypothetical protein
MRKMRASDRWAIIAAAAAATPMVLVSAASAQNFQVSIGVRETNWVDPVVVGGNGGTAGNIEWINLDGLNLVADGTWQQFTFNFGTDPVTAFVGNGVLDGTHGTLEHIRIRNISGVTDVTTLWVDDVVNTVSGSPITLSGFETTDTMPATIGTEHMFQEPRFSGSTQPFLALTPNATLVTDQQFHSGAQSNQADFNFNTSNPASWLRLTTFNVVNQPNVAIDYTSGNTLSFWLRMVVAPPAQRWIPVSGASGDWDDAANWGTGIVPNGVAQTANFLEDINAPATVTLNNPITIGTLRLQSALGYTIVGGPTPNTLTFDGNAEDARIVNAQLGSHTISAPTIVALNVGTSASMIFNVQRAEDVLTISNDVSIQITNNATLTIQKTGPGRLDITNLETPDPVTQPTNLLVSGGTMRFLQGSGRNRFNAVSIAGGATPTAKIDITDNPVVVDYLSTGTSPLNIIKAQIGTAYNGGDWAGNGIGSSLGTASGLGVGYAEAAALPSIPAIFGTIEGAEAILIRLTRFGDANLDGTVNLADFNRLASGFGSTTANWDQGDFTYDSLVNLSDFNRLAANFGFSASPGGPTPEDWATLAGLVPEPSSIAMLGAVSLLSLRRRRH